jgi:hypothetical protein
MIRNDTSTWPSQAAVRSIIVRDTEMARRLQRGVLYGDAEWGLPGMIGRTPAMDTLLLAPRCSDVTSIDCAPLDVQYNHYCNLIDRLVLVPDATLNVTLPDYVAASRMQLGALSTLLNTAKDMLTSEADPILAQARQQLDALFGVAFAVFVMSAVLMRAAVMEVRAHVALAATTMHAACTTKRPHTPTRALAGAPRHRAHPPHAADDSARRTGHAGPRGCVPAQGRGGHRPGLDSGGRQHGRLRGGWPGRGAAAGHVMF